MANILLVEDDDSLRGLLTLLLRSEGHEVSEASSGKRVCEMYSRERFDLVVTDVLMPDMDGLEVIIGLRGIDPKARIIAISAGGHGNAEDYLRFARNLGAQHTLSKPFTNEEFLNVVSSAIEDRDKSGESTP